MFLSQISMSTKNCQVLEFSSRITAKMAKTPSSPLTALGITNVVQPTSANFWNYERLCESTSDQIVAALEMVKNTRVFSKDTFL